MEEASVTKSLNINHRRKLEKFQQQILGKNFYQMTRDLYKIVFINHFAGIPKINERTLRHFIIAKGLNPKKYESLKQLKVIIIQTTKL